jgi:hypothetical protein
MVKLGLAKTSKEWSIRMMYGGKIICKGKNFYFMAQSRVVSISKNYRLLITPTSKPAQSVV